MKNWFNYQFRLKSIEREFKEKPKQAEAGWYRDIYDDLLKLIDRAIAEKCFVVREMY